MNVVFFQVDGVLNFPASEAKAPDGGLGISEARVKKLKKRLEQENAKPVLFGSWSKDWNFDDAQCTPNGVYLNKKMDRRGIHILDKIDTEADIKPWLEKHSNVENYTILREGDLVE